MLVDQAGCWINDRNVERNSLAPAGFTRLHLKVFTLHVITDKLDQRLPDESAGESVVVVDVAQRIAALLDQTVDGKARRSARIAAHHGIEHASNLLDGLLALFHDLKLLLIQARIVVDVNTKVLVDAVRIGNEYGIWPGYFARQVAKVVVSAIQSICISHNALC